MSAPSVGGNLMQFDPHQYAINAGWDFNNIKAVACLGVSEEDERIIYEISPNDAEACIEALFVYCRLVNRKQKERT